MKFRRECVTKRGDPLLLRSLCAADAEAMLRLCRKGAGETQNMMRGADEWAATEAQQAAAIKRAEDGAKSLLLGAFAGGQLIGMCAMQPVQPVDRARHRAGVGLLVLRAFWRQGVGSALMQAVIEAARTTNLEQLELDVVADNLPAAALYQKHGFVEYGRHPRKIKYRDGRYADTRLMMLVLREET